MIEPIDRVHQPATEACQPLLGPCQKAKPPARGTHEHGRHHRYVGETEQDGSDEGKGERERHGLEHLAADTAEEEDGGEDDEDDNLTEERGVHHPSRGAYAHRVHALLRESGAFGQPSPEVALQLINGALDDDDRPVDDDAEVDGSKAHQIGPHAEDAHEDEGKEQREGDERGGDEASADAAQEQHKHEDGQPADRPWQRSNCIAGTRQTFHNVTHLCRSQRGHPRHIHINGHEQAFAPKGGERAIIIVLLPPS